MSATEIAFLALGLVLGITAGAAVMQALRGRAGARREVRVTVAPDAVARRRPSTLADPLAPPRGAPAPGSPEAEALATAPGRTSAGTPVGPGKGTDVLGGGPARPAVGVPIVPGLSVTMPAPALGPAPSAPAATSPVAPEPVAGPVAVAPLAASSPVALATPPVAVAPAPVAAVRATAAVEADVEVAAAPVAEPVLRRAPETVVLPADAVAVTMAAAPAPADASLAAARQRVAELERLAEQAGAAEAAAALALAAVRREHDTLRALVDRAALEADPLELKARKEAAHAAFRAAAAAAGPEASPDLAAGGWLEEVNRLNRIAEAAARELEAGSAELRALTPRLERLEAEASAASVAREAAAGAFAEARDALARSEAAAVAAASVRVAPVAAAIPVRPAGAAADPVVERLLAGDRVAGERVVAALAPAGGEHARRWRTGVALLVEAITSRAIDAGCLDLPGDDPFWGGFGAAERRQVAAALASLGFRFNGHAGFADGRVPTVRELSLAVGYAGVDRDRVVRWPAEDRLPELFTGARVAAAEWLAGEAPDLSLGRMISALGTRAGELADLWNEWERIRPLLLARD